MVLAAARPGAIVVGTDVDPLAVACAGRNGVAVSEGDLDRPLPSTLRGRVDLMTAVVPYVPTEELHLLPRDVLAHEPRRALDGGSGGTLVLVRAAGAADRWLRPGGSVLLELGGDQAAYMTAILTDLGFTDLRVHTDADGHDRAIEGRRGPLPPGAVGPGLSRRRSSRANRRAASTARGTSRSDPSLASFRATRRPATPATRSSP